MQSSHGLVILDRDGVINADSDEFVKSASEWRALPGSIEAIAQLSKAGFAVAVATNQSGIGRGLFSRQALYAMNAKLRRLVSFRGGSITHIAYCPHHPDDGCDCRKPRTGLLQQIARKTGLSLSTAVVVGDSKRDLQAGAAAGCRLWLVRTGNGAATERQCEQRPPTWWASVNVADDLAAASAQIIHGRGT